MATRTFDLQQQLEQLQIAEKLNSNSPTTRQPRDRATLLFEHDFAVENNKDFCYQTATYVHFSKKDLADLTPITLSEMLVPNVHLGRYLVCRTINPAHCRLRIMVCVEDSNDDVEELYLYNLVKKFDMIMDDMMPIGTIILLKEPYMNFDSGSSKTYIRCDSPSDVIFLNDNSPLLAGTKWFVNYEKSQFKSLKAKGNDMFKHERYHQALKLYLNALNVEQTATMHLNISSTLRKLERYQEAYEHAHKAFCLEKSDKASYQMGLSAYKLRDWNTALGHFEKVKDSDSVKDELRDCRQRIEEATTGKYDWYHIYDKLARKESTRFDVADFMGPVKVVDMVDKGKGMVTTRDVEPGDILLVSKAFSLSYESEHGNMTLLRYNTANQKKIKNTLAAITISAIINLKNNPKIGKDLYSLYSGSADRNVDLPYGVIDTERIEKICSYNSFSDYGEHTHLDNGTGLWITPAYVNHSCCFNTEATFFGDVLCLSPARRIKSGEEITITYIDSTWSLSERTRFFEHYNFVCGCRLCEIDRADKNYEYREAVIRDNLEKVLSQKSPALLQNFIDLVKGKFEGRTEMQYQLIKLLDDLADMYNERGDFRNELKVYGELLSITDKNLTYLSIMTLIHMAFIFYNDMSKPKMAKNRLAKAIENSRASIAGTSELFKLRYESILTQSRLIELV
jgi:tetratricopeptide (TPR) repeat protein